MLVHPVIYNLEQLRSTLNSLHAEIHDQLDFLDHGHPSTEQAGQAHQKIESLRGEAGQIQTIFENTIRQVLVNRPKFIKDWANRHINFYRDLLAELEAELPPNETQCFLANEMIQHWGQVIEGKRLFVLDPPYLIQHYRQRQKEFFGLNQYEEQ